MIANSPIAALVCDPNLPDVPIVECNEPFLALTGYERHEVIGRNCRFLQGPATESWAKDTIREGLTVDRPVLVEITNYRKDRSIFRNAVMIVPLFDDAGKVKYYLGSQVEIGFDHARTDGLNGPPSLARAKVEALTSRQREILIQMAEGKLNKQIAFDLGLSERTVKMHRAALFRALEVKTSADAIRIAVEAGH